MIRLLCFISTLAFLMVPQLKAQLVAFAGLDANFPDEFAFVALQDIPNGTEIYFTHANYDSGTNTFDETTGGVLVFTVSGTLSTGTVVQITEASANSFTVTGNGGTATHLGASSNWIVSGLSSNPHYAFGSNTPATPWDDVDEVYALLAVTMNALGTLDPSGNHANAIVCSGFDMNSYNTAEYTADRGSATHATLADQSNFTTGTPDITFDLTAFTSVPVVLTAFIVD